MADSEIVRTMRAIDVLKMATPSTVSAVPPPPTMTAAERRRFAGVIADRVDEAAAAMREIDSVEELERLICLAAVRFQSAEVPGGAIAMLVDELERRRSIRTATILAGFSRLATSDVARPSRDALARMSVDGTEHELPDAVGALQTIDIRRADLVRAQLWTIGLQRPGAETVQVGALAIEHDGHGPCLARGFLSGPLAGGRAAFAHFRRAGDSVEHAAASTAEAAEALRVACARNRELGLAIPHELAIALPLIARAVEVDVDAVTNLLVAPEGELLWTPPEDEDVFGRVARRVLEDFEEWATADGRPLIEVIARSGWRVGAAMLDYTRHANDGALAHWSLFDLVEFFLRWVPEEETLTHQEVRDAPDVAKELLTYLANGGLLTGEDPLDALLERCDALRPDFEEACSDRSRRGLAQSIVMQMREEVLDPTDPAAVQSFIDDFNARPFEERDAVFGPPLDMRLYGGSPPGDQRSADGRKTKRRSAKAARKRNRR